MRNTLTRRWIWVLLMACSSFVAALTPGIILPAYSDTSPELKRFNPQFVAEPGCPVEVTGASCELELDPFGSPVAARHYIDYRNISNRPVAAVKFRIGYVGADGKINQPYVNGDDQHVLQPGEQAAKKWRGDKVDPRITAVKLRVLKVKFADGAVWESVKVGETNAQQQEGYAPLSIESPGPEAGGGVFTPGQPVQFKEYGQQGYKGYPDRTATGPVPFNDSTPSSPNGGQYSTGSFAGAPPAAQQTAAPSMWQTVPQTAPQSAPPAMPAAAAPAAAPPAARAAASVPPAPSPSPTPVVSQDPMTMLDQILGTGKSAAPKAAQAAPAASPDQPPTAAPATAPAQPADAPALRPTLTPGQPASSQADGPPGDGDKSVDLR